MGPPQNLGRNSQFKDTILINGIFILTFKPATSFSSINHFFAIGFRLFSIQKSNIFLFLSPFLSFSSISLSINRCRLWWGEPGGSTVTLCWWVRRLCSVAYLICVLCVLTFVLAFVNRCFLGSVLLLWCNGCSFELCVGFLHYLDGIS